MAHKIINQTRNEKKFTIEDLVKDKMKIVDILKNKKLEPTCPMCKHHDFILQDGYILNPVQKNLNEYNIGGPALPSILLICTNCGYMSQHSVGILGLDNRRKSNGKE